MEKRYEPTTHMGTMGYLIEECGEVLQAIGKTQRWGLHSTNPELPKGDRIPNWLWLRNELADLKEAIHRVEMLLPVQRDPTLEPAGHRESRRRNRK